MNVLGASNLGIHIEENACSWEFFKKQAPCAALLNWNNVHWTVLKCETDGGLWTHINSVINGV